MRETLDEFLVVIKNKKLITKNLKIRDNSQERLELIENYKNQLNNKYNMNFRLTTLKTIISIIIGLILSLLSSYAIYTGGSGPLFRFNNGSIYGFLIGLVITYLIWSLIQKKN